jgi:hypothetical protein
LAFLPPVSDFGLKAGEQLRQQVALQIFRNNKTVSFNVEIGSAP